MEAALRAPARSSCGMSARRREHRSPWPGTRATPPTLDRPAQGRGAPPWLRREPLEQLKQLSAAESASEPFRWDAYVAWWARRRSVVVLPQSMAALARTHDVQIFHPLMEPRFLSAVARRGGTLGWGTRTAALSALFGQVLPSVALARQTKADFTRPYWSGDVRSSSRRGTGRASPPTLSTSPRSVLSGRARPDARTGLLLHAAWVASLPPSELVQSFNCRLE